MVKYRAVSFKKDQIAALYFTMSDIFHAFGHWRVLNVYQLTKYFQKTFFLVSRHRKTASKYPFIYEYQLRFNKFTVIRPLVDWVL